MSMGYSSSSIYACVPAKTAYFSSTPSSRKSDLGSSLFWVIPKNTAWYVVSLSIHSGISTYSEIIFIMHITADRITPTLNSLSLRIITINTARNAAINENAIFASFDPAKKYNATKNSITFGTVGRLYIRIPIAISNINDVYCNGSP